jgi:hypothetical protein
MCIQVVERYAVCRCIYYIHEVDQCALYGQRGHEVSERIVDVGYACPDHSAEEAAAAPTSQAGGRIGGTGHARHHGDDAEHSSELRPMDGAHAINQRQSGLNVVPHWLA